MTTKGERGIKNAQKLDHVVYGRPLFQVIQIEMRDLQQCVIEIAAFLLHFFFAYKWTPKE